MATATKTDYAPRLKERYEGEVRQALKDQFGFSSIMQTPRIEKITVAADGTVSSEPADLG